MRGRLRLSMATFSVRRMPMSVISMLSSSASTSYWAIQASYFAFRSSGVSSGFAGEGAGAGAGALPCLGGRGGDPFMVGGMGQLFG